MFIEEKNQEEKGLYKSMTFQHGCPHHCGPPGGMYFLNTSIMHLGTKYVPGFFVIREQLLVHLVYQPKNLIQRELAER